MTLVQAESAKMNIFKTIANYESVGDEFKLNVITNQKKLESIGINTANSIMAFAAINYTAHRMH